VKQLFVAINDPALITEQELESLAHCLNKTNIAIYKCQLPASKADVQSLAQQVGLAHLDENLCADDDSITSLQVIETGRHGGYIPYSNKRLSWHTDGYYNPEPQTVRAIVMHCVRPAASGGENMYLDPEILYIQLREQDPRWIEALMQPDALTIPANIENGKLIRAETIGPVFSVDKNGYLHMRYSARTRNIEWAKNGPITDATDFITEFLASDSPYIFKYRLQQNEGVISNNVLHNRTGFENTEQQQRLLYRARFYERVNIA
jgi:alpha-ketoglutarate-dependent taurine dioxygenase